MIDLHIHSTFSDGTCSPEELVAIGREKKLTALSLTDHDSTEGTARFLKACDANGITGIPGVEISADVAKGTLHMLGYFVDGNDPDLSRVLHEIRDGRELRNHRIVEKLNKLGIPVTWDEVRGYAGEDVVGRPHFAQALVDGGHVRSKQAAFDKYLAKGKSAYVDRFRLSPEDSIAVIRGSGGVAVLAHPFTLDLEKAELRDFIRHLKDLGLGGLEVYYSEHSAEQVREYLEIVSAEGLVATGGSDFHGDGNPGLKMGTGFGSLSVPDELVDDLVKMREKSPAAKSG